MKTRQLTGLSFGKQRSNGFTLLELLVVILIIGLLTGIVGPRFLGQIGRSEVTAARAQLDAFDKALQAYRIDIGQFPSETSGLQALLVAPPSETRWRGPYLKGQIPRDPWGRPYQYRMPGAAGKDFELQTLGKDGAVGGTGDDTDLAL